MELNANTFSPLLAQPILKRVKWTWVGYGLAAYVGLKLMRRYNIMPGVANKGIDLIERGAKLANPTAI
jgi:hypothetical protein